jgi:hypothetical protein
MAEEKPFDRISPVQSGFAQAADRPDPEKKPWTEKFKAAKELTWVTSLYKNSDYANDFTEDQGFEIEDDFLKTINSNFDKVWADDILESKSENELIFKLDRADRAKVNYETLGNMGFGSITALLSAGITDPAYYPLFFMPYGRLTAGAKQVAGAARIGKYMKTGALIGAGEGTLVGAADYMLRPDAQLIDLFYGAALGSAFGGGMGAVSARLMRDVDTEHFIKQQLKLTEEAEAALAQHTPKMKLKRTIDATAGDAAPKKAPVQAVNSTVVKNKAGDYTYSAGEQSFSITKQGSRWVVQQGDQVVSKHTSLKKATAALDESVDTSVTKQFDEVVEEITEEVTTTRSSVINKLSDDERTVLSKLDIDEEADEVISVEDLASTSGIPEEQLRETITSLEQKGLVARTETAFGDDAYRVVDADDFVGGTQTVTRKVTRQVPRKQEAQTEEQKFEAEQEQALEDEFGDPTPEQVAEDKADLETPDPEDVPVLVRNIFDMFGLRSRLSAIALLTQSKNPNTRWLAMRMALVASGLKDKSGNLVKIPKNASIFHYKFHRANTAALAKTLNKVDTSEITQAEANTRIFHYLNGDTSVEMSPSMLQAADEINKLKKEMFEEGRKLGVFDEAQQIEDYMPRMFQPELLDVLIRRAEDDDIKMAFYKIIKSKNPDMDEAILTRAAAKYWTSLRDTIHRQSYTRSGESKWAALDEDTLRKVLSESDKETGLALTDEQIDALILTKDVVRGKSKNVHSRGRMYLDDIMEVNIAYKKGHPQYGETFKFKLTDLVDTNVERVMGTYIHRMAGATSLARMGIDGDDSFKKMLDDIVDDNIKEYGLTSDRGSREARALQFLYESIRGSYNINEGMDTITRKGLRRVRELNFIRLMGQSGLAAVIETSNVLFENGLKNALDNIPAFRSMLTRAQNGDLSYELSKEFEECFGIGTDIITGKMNSRYEDYTDNYHLFSSDYTKTDEVLAKGRNITSIMGGLSPVTLFLSRWNSVNFTTNMFKKLSAGRLDVYGDVKLKQLGLGEQELVRIKRAMDDLADVDDKGRLRTLNLHRWKQEHPEAYDDFSYALTVETTNNVQVTNIGSGNPFLRSEWGKTLFQFWSFVLGSNEQQFARQMVRIQHGEGAVPASIFMGGLVIASLAYITRTNLNSIGKADREEYLADKLSTGAIAKTTLSYMGMLGMGTFMFNHAGLSSDMLVQNPTLQLTDTVLSSARKVGAAALDGDGHDTLFELAKMLENLSPNHPLTRAPMRALSEQVIGDPN